MALESAHLNWLDFLVLLVYFVGVVAVGYLAVSKNKDNASSYFLASRSVEWWALAMSLFASNIGSDHLVGLCGSGAADGIAVASYEWSAVPALLILGYFAAPIYLPLKIFTTPQYLEQRFHPAVRFFFSILSLLSNLLTKISVVLFGGAVVLEEIAGWDRLISAVLLVLFSGAYTAIGGLRVVVYTEVWQTVLLLIACSSLLVVGLVKIDGWSGLKSRVPSSHFHIFKPIDSPTYPWTGVVFGMFINSIWYWMTDQVMVQRVLGAKNTAHAKAGCGAAAILKLLPSFIFVVPGMIAYGLYGDELQEDSNKAFALLVVRLMPHGLQGLLVAAMVASLMSALASTLNSSSTLFTMDVYREFLAPTATDVHLAMVGRVFTGVFVLLSLMWLPVIELVDDQLFVYIQKVQIIWAPQIAAVFLCGMLSEQVNTAGAMLSLSVCTVIGILFFLADFIAEAHEFPSATIQFFSDFNYLNFAIINFVIAVLLLLCGSFLDDKPTAEQLNQTTWWSRGKDVADGDEDTEGEEGEEGEEKEDENEEEDPLISSKSSNGPQDKEQKERDFLENFTSFVMVPVVSAGLIASYITFA